MAKQLDPLMVYIFLGSVVLAALIVFTFPELLKNIPQVVFRDFR